MKFSKKVLSGVLIAGLLGTMMCRRYLLQELPIWQTESTQEPSIS